MKADLGIISSFVGFSHEMESIRSWYEQEIAKLRRQMTEPDWDNIDTEVVRV